MWEVSVNEDKILEQFERKILTKKFGSKKKTENIEYKQRTNAELMKMFNEPGIVSVLKFENIAGQYLYVEQRIR